ncbi:aminotransferase class IV [Brevibacterium aurantiacum]|uniref:aminotransferase class IV n=1 Tax=Brevibacterium aurantiacum TaxID=273384 RepID=UPI000DF4351A|nr:aminotransferase class IV [Brevibacterium aurantiacum]TGD08461.1 aminotransferase class IV [Brevibacterium sp. S111]
MTVWVWNSQESRFEKPPEDVDKWTLLAADSWLVVDGRVRAFDRHQARFADTAGQVGVGALVSAELWASVIEKIPKTGEWFPRVDVLEQATGGSRMLAFRLRPAPPRTRKLRVLIPSYSDPRSTPGRKGPDIALLEQLRKQAREEYDCDEVLLLSEDGYIIEGATTSLMWWDGGTLCLPDPSLGALTGVTSAVIRDEACAQSIPVEYKRIHHSSIVQRDVWLVNAASGVRRVREVVDVRASQHRLQLPNPTPPNELKLRLSRIERTERFNRFLERTKSQLCPL